MACYKKTKNEMVTCPFDPAHRMLQSRLQIHIAKCKSNNLDKDMEICPFNATHLLARGLLTDHLTKCPDRLPVDKKLSTAMDKNNIFKGRTSVPSYHQPVPPCEETWDISNSATAGYIPQAAPPKDGIVSDLGLMKPAERRNFYRASHTVRGATSENDKVKVHEPLRQPRQKHEDLMPEKAHENVVNIGLGRGQPRADNRIVADIFYGESPTQEFRQPQSYKQVVAGMSNCSLGMGRGLAQPVSSKFDEDFPALGRGIPVAVGQNSPTVKNEN